MRRKWVAWAGVLACPCSGAAGTGRAAGAIRAAPFSRLSLCSSVRYHARLYQRARNHFREPEQTMSSSKDQYREKFRPESDSALDRELSAALGDVSLEK